MEVSSSAPTQTTTVETTQAQTNEAVEIKDVPQGTPQEAKPEDAFKEYLKKHKEKLKVNGEEIEVDYETMKRDYQIRKASEEKFRQADLMNKKVENFLHILKTDPKKILLNPNLGLDIRSLAEEILVENLQEEMMDPRDRELKKYKQMMEQIELEKQQAKEAEENKRLESLREKYSQDFSQQIVTALAQGGLPKTEHTVKRMAYYMHQAISNGYELKPQDVVGLVKQDYINEQKTLFGAMDEDTLAQILEEQTFEKLRKYDAKRLKNNTLPKTPKADSQPEVFKKAKQQKGLTLDEWRENLKKFD